MSSLYAPTIAYKYWNIMLKRVIKENVDLHTIPWRTTRK